MEKQNLLKSMSKGGRLREWASWMNGAQPCIAGAQSIRGVGRRGHGTIRILKGVDSRYEIHVILQKTGGGPLRSEMIKMEGGMSDRDREIR